MKNKVLGVISWFFNPPYRVGKILVLLLALYLFVCLTLAVLTVEVIHDSPGGSSYSHVKWRWQ